MSKIPKSPIIGIIGGKGKMGRLFANFFKEKGFKVLISDLKTKLNNIELAQTADIVIISVPIALTEQTIKEIAPHIRKSALLSDLTSIKSTPVKAMLKSRAEVIGLHPMFGSTNPISGQRIIMCPARSKNWYSWLKSLFEENKITTEKMTAREHDTMMTLVQGLVHFADIAFAQTLKSLKIKPEKFLKFASPASEVKISFAARLLAQDPELYGSIQIHNPRNIKTFKKYLKNIERLMKIDSNKDQKAFKKYFDQAAKYLGAYKKRALNETTWLIDQVLDNRKKNEGSIALIKKIKPHKAEEDQIATLGPKYTYSDFAVHAYSGKDNSAYFCNQISEVFEAVNSGVVKQGVVPIENSHHGTVRETMDALLANNLKIIDELYLPIHHCLVRVGEQKALVKIEKKDLTKITTICTKHPVFAQCHKFTSKKCPQAKLRNFSSTTAGMKYVLKERDQRVVAVGSPYAAKKLGLEILEDNIEDDKYNQTRFLVIAKRAKTRDENKKCKTSIAFSFGKDAPGNLATVLQEFSKRKIDLSSIESRPTQKAMGDYVFYIDFKGHQKDKAIKECLSVIKEKVSKLKILGSYSGHSL